MCYQVDFVTVCVYRAMDGDECEFSDPELSRSHRGSVASSVSRTQDVLVYLVGDSAVHLCVEGVVSVCVQELGRLVRQPLNITDCDQDAFAFWLCSPLLELQLKPKHQPYKLCRQWQDLLYRFTDASTEDISVDEPCLQYKRNVFYPKAKELQVEDEGVLKLLYEEARLNILENRYPCDPEHWIRLGALSCAIEFGSGLDDYKLIVAVRCAFFAGEIDKPAQGILHRGGRKSVSVGISLEGVYVMDMKEKHVLLGLRFSELSWDHSYPETEGDSHILWLEFDGEEDGTPVNKLLKIYSKQAELMNGLIEFCVELRSVGNAAVAADMDGDATASQEPAEHTPSSQTQERRSRLRRQSSVMCSRIHTLNTISYVDDGKEIKRLKPKRATSFFTRQAPPTYSTVQVTDSLEQG
ncbi:FERM domain-containing protein 8 isoform X3 [Astyanax mexicanus]|uniref:FERM domain-containing protein 8 isoform X3 n=1 Tax=Astyanax mexicanus TaxID=7994 RepID=UPI000BBE004F|nr:FERM domain-containing protein 8 isoform X3 [Astyanax mexicanus]